MILDEEVVGMALLDRTYQASDLAGAARREFLDRAKTGEAHLRDTDGTPLVMLPEGNLGALRELGAWFTAYLSLETALLRDRQDRRPSDFGALAWAQTLDEELLAEMRGEMRDTLVVAASRQDAAVVEALMRDWEYTAVDYGDPVAGPILRGERSDSEFVEARPPGLTER